MCMTARETSCFRKFSRQLDVQEISLTSKALLPVFLVRERVLFKKLKTDVFGKVGVGEKKEIDYCFHYWKQVTILQTALVHELHGIGMLSLLSFNLQMFWGDARQPCFTLQKTFVEFRCVCCFDCICSWLRGRCLNRRGGEWSEKPLFLVSYSLCYSSQCRKKSLSLLFFQLPFIWLENNTEFGSYISLTFPRI